MASQGKLSTSRGLAHWMGRVAEECERAGAGFEAGPVHDLRVALRRCRSVADSMRRIDPDPDWRELRRLGRPLFRSLGELRDIQVVEEWVRRLGAPEDPLRSSLLTSFAGREVALKAEAQAALEGFSRKKWDRLARRLPSRLRRIPEGGSVFESLALERWSDAMESHRAALRRRSRIGWHRLRIVVKRFRYVLENFLPARYAEWSEDLKRFQDLLGDVHDLDVLSAELVRLAPAHDAEVLAGWRSRIDEERKTRLAAYRSLTRGARSLWSRWRLALPDDERLRTSSIERLAVSASLLDPGFRRTRQVTRLALALLRRLARLDLDDAFADEDARRWLEAAGLLHGVGRARRKKGFHKASRALILRLPPPPGWSAEEMKLVALIARYHRGAEPSEGHKDFSELDEASRHRVAALAGVLRLACALGAVADPSALHVDVERLGDVLQIGVAGLPDTPRAAARAASARHLLEVATGRSIFVRPRAHRPRLVAARRSDPRDDSGAGSSPPEDADSHSV